MATKPPRPAEVGRGLRSYVRQSLLTGLALTVPILVTLFVLVFALNFLTGALDPVVTVMQETLGFDTTLSRVALQVAAVVLLVVIIFVVGAAAESQYGSGRVERRVDSFLTSIPGLGSIYESLNEMSQLLLSRDTDSFQEVKLVEYPEPGSYTIAFLTAEPSDAVLDATGHNEMVTLFMPMAPNPFMGGFVIHVAADRVYDVDMTVEEGVQAIVSSGIAVDENLADGEESESAGESPAPGGYRPRDPDRGGYEPGGDGSDGPDRYRTDGAGAGAGDGPGER
jgi:uncharacterized membrane protein